MAKFNLKKITLLFLLTLKERDDGTKKRQVMA